MLTVTIVDDQARFRQALSTVVEVTEGLRLGGCFASVAELRAAVSAEPGAAGSWDVVLMDLEMPGESGLVGLRLLKEARPGLPVVMCTVYDDGDSVQRAVQQGADGYLLKSAPLPELLRRVREVTGGGSPLAPEVARGLLEQLRGGGAGDGAQAEETEAAWVVAADGSELTSPEGATVDLRRRQAVRRILVALARARVASPGTALSAEDCIEAGWPGERMSWASAQARLWTSIRTLRALGLEDALETVGEGYRLSTEVRVRAD